MLLLLVIVPTYNSQRTLAKCLQAIRRSTYENYMLTVVDCGSKDSTLSTAEKLADRVIKLKGRPRRAQARLAGIKSAECDIIVNIDSDVIIRSDALSKISDYFTQHPEVDALTGILSKNHPNPDFFSQYKNLYMHYIFKKLSGKVTFLYGSVHAIRANAAALYECDKDIKITDDTDMGQRLFAHGKQIVLLKDLEVNHLKKYNFFSFIKNNFQVPFDWAKIFFKYRGWKQIGRNKTGFAHSSKKQLLSLVLACIISLVVSACLFGCCCFPGIIILISIWIVLNFDFFYFLVREKGLLFGIFAFFVTFIDNVIMLLGIVCGSLAFFISKINYKNKKCLKVNI